MELEAATNLQRRVFVEKGGDYKKVIDAVFLGSGSDWTFESEIFREYIFQKLLVIDAARAIKNRLKIPSENSEEQDAWFILSVVEDAFSVFVTSCYMGGIDQSEFCSRMYEGFLHGGLPCGWIGDTSYEDGGKARDSLVMLHFGETEEKNKVVVPRINEKGDAYI